MLFQGAALPPYPTWLGKAPSRRIPPARSPSTPATCPGAAPSSSHRQQGDRPAPRGASRPPRDGTRPVGGSGHRGKAGEAGAGGWEPTGPGPSRRPHARPPHPPGLGRRHLSRSQARGHPLPRPGSAAQSGPPAPRAAHQAHDARHHLRLRQEAPQVEGAAGLGRAVGPALHVAVAPPPSPHRRRRRRGPPRTQPPPRPGPAPGAWPARPQGPRAKCGSPPGASRAGGACVPEADGRLAHLVAGGPCPSSQKGAPAC